MQRQLPLALRPLLYHVTSPAAQALPAPWLPGASAAAIHAQLCNQSRSGSPNSSHAPSTSAQAHRSFAAPAASSSSRMDYEMNFAGGVMDAYGGPIEAWVTSLLTREGRGAVRQKFVSWVQLGMALVWCNRNVPGFKYADMKGEMLQAYAGISQGIADGRVQLIQDLVTPTMLHTLRDEVAKRQAAGWHRIKFELVEPPDLRSMRFVFGRLIKISKESRIAFVQLTARLPCKQRFAAYDRSGRLVAGDPTAVLPVVDHWVFERKILEVVGKVKVDPPDARWRLAGRLTVAEGPAEAAVRGE